MLRRSYGAPAIDPTHSPRFHRRPPPVIPGTCLAHPKILVWHPLWILYVVYSCIAMQLHTVKSCITQHLTKCPMHQFWGPLARNTDVQMERSEQHRLSTE